MNLNIFFLFNHGTASTAKVISLDYINIYIGVGIGQWRKYEFFLRVGRGHIISATQGNIYNMI